MWTVLVNSNTDFDCTIMVGKFCAFLRVKLKFGILNRWPHRSEEREQCDWSPLCNVMKRRFNPDTNAF